MIWDLLFIGIIGFGVWGWWDRRAGGKITGEDPIRVVLQIMRENGITLEQLAKADAEIPPGMETAALNPKRDAGEIAVKVFTYLGGIFVLGGIGAYVAMFWPTMSPAMHIFITLGIGLALSFYSCVVMKEGKHPHLVLPLIIIATVIETGGWGVFIDEVFPHTGKYQKALAFICGVMALQQWLTYYFFRRTLLFFLASFFSYGFLANALDLLGMKWEYILLLLGGSLICVSYGTQKTQNYLLTGLGYFFGGVWFNIGIYDLVGQHTDWNIAAIVSGITTCCLAYGLVDTPAHRVSSFFYFVGSACFYAGLFQYVEHTQLELLYLGVAIAMMYGHSALNSREVLLTSTFAILGFIGYYTHEHFVNSVGWPVALVLLGVAFFAVGTMAMRIRQRSK